MQARSHNPSIRMKCQIGCRIKAAEISGKSAISIKRHCRISISIAVERAVGVIAS
jgi:hypothetical protein